VGFFGYHQEMRTTCACIHAVSFLVLQRTPLGDLLFDEEEIKLSSCAVTMSYKLSFWLTRFPNFVHL
jgi:hypothetical protein